MTPQYIYIYTYIYIGWDKQTPICTSNPQEKIDNLQATHHMNLSKKKKKKKKEGSSSFRQLCREKL